MRVTVYYKRGTVDPILENSLVLASVRQYMPTAHESPAVSHEALLIDSVRFSLLVH